jgi:cytoskeletal protein RodZ
MSSRRALLIAAAVVLLALVGAVVLLARITGNLAPASAARAQPQAAEAAATPAAASTSAPTPTSVAATPTPAARATAAPTPTPTAQAPQGQTIVSFGAPSTFRCDPNATPGTRVHLTWTTTSTTGVTISIDGPGKFADYPASGSADLPFACSEPQHTYLITTQGSGPAATRTVVVKRA